MNRYLLLSAAVVPLLGTGCKKPKPDVSDRVAELEQRVATAEQEAAEARAARQETERLLEEQRLAVERDALERERVQLEQERAQMERLQEEQQRATDAEIRQREAALAQREQSAIDLQNSLSEQQQTIEQREAELSDRDRELAGREAVPAAQPAAAAPEPAVDVQVFYDSLSPYGSWFDSPDYGYVWRPMAYRTVGWRPYTHGRWACTDRGWMWVSDEPFGWATYHYGRWALCRTNGWIWVPGNEWAPSWVTWRSSGSHIGWAPLPPETLAYRGRRWDSTVEVTFGIGSAWFSFVETRNFGGPIHAHCLPYTRNDFYWGNTINITNIHIHNNRVISGGPSYGDIARQTSRRPPFYRIEEDRNGRPGQGGGYNRIDNGRVVVTPPRREEPRNPGTVMNRQPRISGKLDHIEVVRTKPLEQDIVREFRKNRDESRNTEVLPREITQRQEEPKPRDRGEEQRRHNEKAQELEKEARANVDDRIRVLPRHAGGTSIGPAQPKQPAKPPTQPIDPPTQPTDRGEEQRRFNEKAQELEKEARANVDDRIRVLPRRADDTPQQPRVPNPPLAERPKTPSVSPLPPETRRPHTPAPPPVMPRREDTRAQDNAREEQARQQQLQAAEQQRQQRQAEEARRQQQAAEEARRQQQRQAEAQRENQRRQQQAAEEARRQQQQRQAEENSRRQQQQRQAEEQQRRNKR
jgi:hypothetical protein